MFNGDRIRQAREIVGMTQEQLADAIGASQTHIALFEQNLRQPQDETITFIAIATGFPVGFFRREKAPEFPLGSLLYRRHKSMSSKDRDKVRQSARLLFETILDMADRFKPIDLRLPRLSSTDPERAAKITRAELGFSPDTPVVHLLTQLEKNGVIVALIPYEIDEYDAFSVWADTEPRTPVIVMTTARPGDRQRWNAAHELGHLVMHISYSGSHDELERDANRFAAEFLLPEDVIRPCLSSAPLTLTMLADLKSYWGVSIKTLIMRAFELEIITDGQRRYLFRQMAAKGWNVNEPVPIPQEKPRLLRKLSEALYGQSFDAKAVAASIDIPAHVLTSVIGCYASSSEMRGSRPPTPPQRSDAKPLLVMARTKT